MIISSFRKYKMKCLQVKDLDTMQYILKCFPEMLENVFMCVMEAETQMIKQLEYSATNR